MAVRVQYTVTLARVNDGAKGNTGQGVSAVKDQYYLSGSNTSLTGGSWSDTIPAYKEGYYYWTRSQITWINPAKTTYTDAVLDNGLNAANINAYDAKNLANQSVKSISQEYYLSTSNESATGGSWSNSLPERTEGTFYWIRYRVTYQNGSVSYSPSSSGQLLNDINDLWAQVTENKSSIKSTDSEVQINSSKMTSFQNELDGKVDQADFDSINTQTTDSLTKIREQISSLQVKSDSITAQVTDNQKAIGEVKQSTAQLTTAGLNVDTGLTTVSTVDGRGLTITDKSDDEVIANFTTGESTIQNLKIMDHLKVGAHLIQKMQNQEYDGSTDWGTGFMWTGGN